MARSLDLYWRLVVYLRNDAESGRSCAAIPTGLTWIDDAEHIVVVRRSETTADVVEVVERYGDRNRVTAIRGDVAFPLAELSGRVVHLSFADESSIVQARFAATWLKTHRAS